MSKFDAKTSDQTAAITSKWDDAVSSGFTAVPNALIKSQSHLGITASELNVLLNLLLHWWFKSDLPFPSSNTISRRTGMEIRTVQRHLKSLRRKNYIEKIKVNDKNVYSFEGLKVALEKFSNEDIWSSLKSRHT
ncbi:MAG: hypothetical protein COB92_06190 [Robiginitomaculum sp.]|nr:MAG: hypothetical protein COB92_06190 [Robiginitomaculum sp.]